MNRHLVLISDTEFKEFLSGEANYLVRFFKKKMDFLEKLSVGDLVYFKKMKGEVLGQFNVGKVVLVENLEVRDFQVLRQFSKGISREVFDKKLDENNTMVIVGIEKLEQFITSPIDVPTRLRKEWSVLE